MTQINKTKKQTNKKTQKNGKLVLGKNTFFTSVLTIAIEMPQTKGKILTRCVIYYFWNNTYSNRNNDTKIL